MNAKFIAAVCLCMTTSMLGATSTAFAASESQKAQQAKFGECSHEAKMKGLKGSDFKSFMKRCASGSGSTSAASTSAATATAATAPKATTDKRMSQQEKMKQCNGDARTKGLTGDARKSFMKSCLSS